LTPLIDSFAPAQLTSVGATFGSLSEAFPRLRIPESRGTLRARYARLLHAFRGVWLTAPASRGGSGALWATFGDPPRRFPAACFSTPD